MGDLISQIQDNVGILCSTMCNSIGSLQRDAGIEDLTKDELEMLKVLEKPKVTRESETPDSGNNADRNNATSSQPSTLQVDELAEAVVNQSVGLDALIRALPLDGEESSSSEGNTERTMEDEKKSEMDQARALQEKSCALEEELRIYLANLKQVLGKVRATHGSIADDVIKELSSLENPSSSLR